MNENVFTYITDEALPAEQAYDLAADFYDGWKWQEFWRTYEYPLAREAIDRYKRGRHRDLSVLDVGCGTGWYLEQLDPISRSIVGIDISQRMLAIARSRLKKRRPKRRTILVHGNASRLPFARRHFDVVICTRVLSHLPRPDVALEEMRRVLIPGGILVLSDVDSAHNYEFTRLPAISGKLSVETYKHNREDLFLSIGNIGFVQDVTYLIDMSGNSSIIERSRDHNRDIDVAGWVGAWRKSDT